MHFSVFEELHLTLDEQIFFTDEKGHGHHGLYKANYNRQKAEFDFYTFNGGKIERISLNKVQVLQRN